MTEERKTYLQHAFNYGSILGFFSFCWYLTGFYLGFDKHPMIYDNIYFFISISIIIAMMISYRRMQENQTVKFSRFFTIGFVATTICALFISAFAIIRIAVLDPYFIYTFASSASQYLQEYNITYNIDSPSLINVFKISYVIANFFVCILNNIIYILLISAFMTLNNRIYNK
ncbi:MAG: DUF4199 family protein [Bacteroidales bacterium]|nr:DUF4199 family protein [Bacteroidales bacterium]